MTMKMLIGNFERFVKTAMDFDRLLFKVAMRCHKPTNRGSFGNIAQQPFEYMNICEYMNEILDCMYIMLH